MPSISQAEGYAGQISGTPAPGQRDTATGREAQVSIGGGGPGEGGPGEGGPGHGDPLLGLADVIYEICTDILHELASRRADR